MNISSTEPIMEAAAAVTDLLGRLRTGFALVGDLAYAAWTAEKTGARTVDVLAVVSPEGKQQIPMMAGNRGFEMDRELIASAEEIDVIPLGWRGVRIHILIASNALYGRMVAESVAATLGEQEVKVVNAEDLALLLMMSEDPSVRTRVDRLRGLVSAFDVNRFNQKLVSLGLSRLRLST